MAAMRCRSKPKNRSREKENSKKRKLFRLRRYDFLSKAPPAMAHVVPRIKKAFQTADRRRREKRDLERAEKKQELALEQTRIDECMRMAEEERRRIARERAAALLATSSRPLPSLWHSNPLAENAQEVRAHDLPRPPRELPMVFAKLGLSVARSRKRGDMSQMWST